MADIVLGITLKANGDGMVGELKLGAEQLDRLGNTAKQATDKGTAGIDLMGRSLRALRAVALNAIAGFIGFQMVRRVFGELVEEIMAAEKAQANLEGVLRATQGAARLTADEIGGLADELERTTLFDDNEIKQAAAVLLTFRRVQGDTFREALMLATDLAALMGGDLQGAVLQLGKALQDPTEGLTALRRSGISFTEQQQELIKSLVETGRQGEAMRMILDEVGRQVGGVAQSQVTGLTGATNDLEDAWGDLLKSFKDSSGLELTIRLLEAVTVKIRELIDTGPKLEDWIDILSFSPLVSLLGGTNFSWSDLIPDDAFTTTAEEARAEIERLTAALTELRKLPEDQVAPAEIAALERRLQAMRVLAGDIASHADDQARFVGRSQGRLGPRPGAPAGDDDAPGIPDQDELDRLAKRTELVRQYHIELAAGQDEDRAAAFERSAEMIDAMNEATQEAIDADKQLGEALRQALLTPQEEYNESLATYNRLLAEGAIGQETWRRAVAKAGEELEAANDNALELKDTIRDAGTTIAQEFEDVVVAGGKVSDMLEGLGDDFIRILTRIAFTKPFESIVGGIGDWFGDWLGSALGSVFSGGGGGHPVIGHRGGKVGSLPRHDVPMTAFAGAPRMHGGGMIGPGEVPVIAKQGEEIGWPDQLRRKYGGDSGVQVVINNNTGQQARAEERQTGDGRRMIEITIGDAVARDVRSRGPVAQQLESTYGLGRRAG